MTKSVVFDLDNTLAEIGKGIAVSNILKLRTLEARGVELLSALESL